MTIDEILAKIKNKIESRTDLDVSYFNSGSSDNGFEKLVCETLKEVEIDSNYSFKYEAKLGHHFPDIDVYVNELKYGVELKSTRQSWKTNGNSIFESISSSEYEDIFIFFGKNNTLKNGYDVKYLSYWKAIVDIKVTHSPRFIIDMDAFQNTVFNSYEQYDDLRNTDQAERTTFIQKYLKENSEGSRWYLSDPEVIQPTSYAELKPIIKKRLFAELCLLFPKQLLTGKHSNKYDDCAAYMLETYFVYSSSLRDIFSSGGSVYINEVRCPKIFERFRSSQGDIIELVSVMSEDFKQKLYESWNKYSLSLNFSGDIYSDYKLVVDKLEYLESGEIYCIGSFIFD